MKLFRWCFATILFRNCVAFLEFRNLRNVPFKISMSKCGNNEFDRRSFIAIGGALPVVLLPQFAHAKEELFKPNPLTNPLLEQLRILEQAEKDNIQYGGELEAGDAGNRGRVDNYPKLLVPILKMSDELAKIESLVHGSREDWKEAKRIIQQPKYDKIEFKVSPLQIKSAEINSSIQRHSAHFIIGLFCPYSKKTFNAFSDNIYYSDPDRANLYLGGGATPKTEQSIAYLLRNEILTNIEALQAELEYLLKNNEDETEDLYKYSSQANAAMKDYLNNVSPDEKKRAKALIATTSVP